MPTSTQQIDTLLKREYKAGFITDVEADSVPPGLNEDTIRLISAKKSEPEFMREWRLKAYRHWLIMTTPAWAHVHYPPIDYQAIVYYSAPKTGKDGPRSLGIIFCSFSEAVQNHPELVQKYLGSVVPYTDNFYATLNSAVFTDGSFVYVPQGVRCPMELSTYFRINASKTGQFERTLIVADEGAYVSYLEGCTAPMRDENQLHAAVVE